MELPALGREAVTTILEAGWSILWALVGRFLYVANLIRTGKRKRFWSIQTVWELAIAVGMGVIAGGVGDYLHLDDLTYAGFISAASYLGPQVFQAAIERWASIES